MSRTRSVSPDQLTIDFEAVKIRHRDKEIRERLFDTPKEFFQPISFETGGISSLPTWYDGDGINYRSRTEARWAVLFNYLGIHYIYEIEKFKRLGGASIPDFYLPDYNVFYEVGPGCIEINEVKQDKAQELASATGVPVLVTKGFPNHRSPMPLVAGCTLSLPEPYADKVADADVIGNLFPKLRGLKDWAGEAVSDAVDLARNYQFEAARDFRLRVS